MLCSDKKKKKKVYVMLTFFKDNLFLLQKLKTKVDICYKKLERVPFLCFDRNFMIVKNLKV